ncbi:tyrosine-type recombinase/integrase [Nocardia sp. ET3-3]|uniref:Tyrosine-type recombinase/integrase n=1 Tax=Nocardia terrae TaxID=2675851 RepID=A0A7K1V2A6_9NOCA|nr:site-specific integrase [Nocardia terrae]MVU80622.1 tyrosine-type recombinase/integrase [Nocardia terrae]
MEDWEQRFEVNRNKGSVRKRRNGVAQKRFTTEDKMIDVFDWFIDVCERRVVKGEIKRQTVDTYKRMIYVSEGPRSKDDAIRLETEMGGLTLGEVGDSGYLADYLDDIAVVAPGIAHQHYSILSGIFKRLVLNGPFKYSPMLPVSNPSARGGQQRALRLAEREALYDLFTARARWTKYRVMLLLLLLGTGLRIGEALALRWMDVDLRAGDECAVIHVCGTVVKGVHGSFRQEKRKNNGRFYYLTLPMWLTVELREWRRLAGDVEETAHVLVSKRGCLVSTAAADQLLQKVVRGTALEWVQYGNLRDTAATHVAGKTNDPLRASAQLGHKEASTIATVHYIDPEGYTRPAVDNVVAMESLRPSKREQSVSLEAA